MSHSIIDLRYGFQSSYLRVLCMNKHITLQIIGKQYKYHMILHWYPWIIQINTSFLAYYLIYFNFNIIYLLHFVIYVYVCVYVNKYITQVRNDIFIDSRSKVQEETGSFSRPKGNANTNINQQQIKKTRSKAKIQLKTKLRTLKSMALESNVSYKTL